MNFFEWIRDGVKQSVLLGVNDAVESLGTPAEDDKFHPNMVALLDGSAGAQRSKGKRRANSGGATRKRLGKSLKEMDPSS